MAAQPLADEDSATWCIGSLGEDPFGGGVCRRLSGRDRNGGNARGADATCALGSRRPAASRRSRSSRSRCCWSARRARSARIRRHLRLKALARGLALRPCAADLRADRGADRAHRQRLLLLVGGGDGLPPPHHQPQRRRARDRPRAAGRRGPADASAATPRATSASTISRSRCTMRRSSWSASGQLGVSAEARAHRRDRRRATSFGQIALATGRRHPGRPFLLRIMPIGRRAARHRDRHRARRGTTRTPRRSTSAASRSRAVMPGKRPMAWVLVIARPRRLPRLADLVLLTRAAPTPTHSPGLSCRPDVDAAGAAVRSAPTPRSSIIARPATSSRSSRSATTTAWPATPTSTTMPIRASCSPRATPRPQPASAALRIADRRLQQARPGPLRRLP